MEAIVSDAELGAAEVRRLAAEEALRAVDVSERRAELLIAERLIELADARRGLAGRVAVLTRRSHDLQAMLRRPRGG
jgi:hypothetical protein